ncbi:MAG: agmatinase [Clostridia bacterium]
MSECMFIGCDKTLEQADIVVFGAPFDGTVSFRPGTRFAPASIRQDSMGLESYSPYLDLDLSEDASVHDSGDLFFPLGNTEKTLDIIHRKTKEILALGKKPFMVGGEHLVTLPAVKAIHEKYRDLCLIHFDAHADLRPSFAGELMSHATVIHRIWEFLGDGRIYQFGIRSGMKSEFQRAEKGHVYTEKFTLSTVEAVALRLKDLPVYVTLDIDVLDPGVVPGTGTPEPGGVSFQELHQALLSLKGLNIVGGDLVELSPHYDASGTSTAAACKLMREFLLVMG